MGYTPHVAVIGGGLTGTAVARDLAMRGLDVTLLERGRLAGGATGTVPGLLDGGARVAIDDRKLAAARHAELRILRDVAAHCVRETGGLVLGPGDDTPGSLDAVESATREAGLPVDRLSGEAVSDREPGLAADVREALSVPAATVDPFRLCRATATSAAAFGADVRTHTELVDVVPAEPRGIEAVLVRDRGSHEGESDPDPETTDRIEPDYVVNAAGSRADRIADLAGASLSLAHRQQAMAVLELGTLESVILEGIGESGFAVPHESTTVVGAATREVADPSGVDRSFEDVDAVFDRVARFLPAVDQARPLRAFWGVETTVADRSVTAVDAAAAGGAAIVDHADTDDCWGITSVVGGSPATHRLTAQAVGDRICAEFGIDRECATDETPLPGSERKPATRSTPPVVQPVYDRTANRLGGRTAEVLDYPFSNPVVCACEGVTKAEVRDVLYEGLASRPDLGAVRTATRMGMGTCQSCNCAHVGAAELYPTLDVDAVDEAFRSFLAERWRGQRPVAWGDALAQLATTYQRHVTTMNWNGGPAMTASDVDWDEFDDGPPGVREPPDPLGGEDA